MFLMLVFTCILHQAYATLSEKIERYPLRPILLRMIETIGRLGIFPTVVGFYVTTVAEISPGFNVTMITIVTVACAYIAAREVGGMRSTTKKCLYVLLDKINAPDLKINDLSTAEVLAFNFWKFRIFSTSPMHIARMLSEHGQIAPPGSDAVKLRNLQTLHELTRDSAVTTNGKTPREVSISVLNRSNSVSSRARASTASEAPV